MNKGPGTSTPKGSGSHRRRLWTIYGSFIAAAALAIGLILALQPSGPTLPRTTSPTTTAPTPTPTTTGAPVSIPPNQAVSSFHFGFDFSTRGPYAKGRFNPAAVTSAQQVMKSIPGMFEDTSIDFWGVGNPEPRPGDFQLSGIASRLRLISSTGGVPVITLCGAPSWMTGGVSGPKVAPTPSHYEDFAALAAKIASAFPQVKYFVVWNELKGFYSKSTRSYDIAGYTEMYNDVYRAIKTVRPDAQIGGPYVIVSAYAHRPQGELPTTPHGSWGYVKQSSLDDLSYWLRNAVGADFVVVDAHGFARGQVPNPPLVETGTYVAVDEWIRQHSSLPIWWIETPVQPAGSGWSEAQAAAVRIAAEVEMRASGASVGMFWQPQEGGGTHDEGLWTSTQASGGGKPTVLAQLLPKTLSILADPVSDTPGEPSGVLVAVNTHGAGLAINTTASSVTATVAGHQTSLSPGQVYFFTA